MPSRKSKHQYTCSMHISPLVLKENIYFPIWEEYRLNPISEERGNTIYRNPSMFVSNLLVDNCIIYQPYLYFYFLYSAEEFVLPEQFSASQLLRLQEFWHDELHDLLKSNTKQALCAFSAKVGQV